MNCIRNTFLTIAFVLGAASPVLAQTGRVDKSGLFVWAFIGFCALIVAAQAIPALIMMVGTARAVAKKVKEGEPVPAESEVKGS